MIPRITRQAEVQARHLIEPGEGHSDRDDLSA